MPKLHLSIIGLLIAYFTQAQPATTVANVPKDAPVKGTITHMHTKKPLHNELIVFQSEKTGREYHAVSDSNGAFFTRLVPGDTYEIFIMGFKDSSSYTKMNIPALGPNQFYKNPFVVDIKFEPAKTFVLENVEFDFGKATLRPQSYAVLDDLIEWLNRKPDGRIEIGGHTDNVGTDAKNKVLSLERAKSVVAYLIGKGIAASRVEAKGYGADEPLEENDTEEGRQKNRRTEVKIL
jgi:outer membrane protein OmpA-like peptidoglycan-associated protein